MGICDNGNSWLVHFDPSLVAAGATATGTTTRRSEGDWKKWIPGEVDPYNIGNH
jgi:hypothetical protein